MTTRYAPKTPYKFVLNLPAHIADTVHLTAEEHGAYLRLLFAYWRSGPPKDDDRTLARIVGMSIDEWADIRPMVEPFFDVLHGQWLHWRLDEELEAAYDAINKASNAGRVAAKARWGKGKAGSGNNDECEGDATALRPHCESQFQMKDKEHALRAVQARNTGKPQKPQAKASKFVPRDFEADVRIAERDLGIGGAA